MSTRAASATASLRAKQNLVRLLFHKNISPSVDVNTSTLTTTSDTVSKLNHYNNNENQYSYSDLRKAYLQRIQELHPDKHYNSSMSCTTAITTGTTDIYGSSSVPNDKNPAEDRPRQPQLLFVQIQEAWKVYESFVKQSKCNVTSSIDDCTTSHTKNSNTGSTKQYPYENHDPNFTLFGVGCSFADNEQERNYRNYIMDQASRGYFTSGELPSDASSFVASTNHHHPQQSYGVCGTNNNNHNFYSTTTTKLFISNVDDECLAADEHDNIVLTTKWNHQDRDTNTTTTATATTNSKQSASLVGHLIPPHRRRHPNENK